MAKKSLECSALQNSIQSGELSVSKASRIISVIDESNQAEWVQKATHLTKRELEKQVAKKNPRASVPDHFRHIAEDLIHMQAGIDEECFEKIKRVQELISQKQKYRNQGSKLQDVLIWCLDELLERHDPLVKAQRILKRDSAQAENSNRTENSNRAENSNKSGFALKNQVEVGNDELSNLVTLCQFHHQNIHSPDSHQNIHSPDSHQNIHSE